MKRKRFSEEQIVELSPNYTMVLYTDGISDANNR